MILARGQQCSRKREHQATGRILAGNLQDANIPAPGPAATEEPASRLPLPGQPVTRVIRREHRTSLTANLGCWHARPMSVSATLTPAPGCSPWRLRSALAARRLPSRTVATGPTWGTQVSADMARSGALFGVVTRLPGRCRFDYLRGERLASLRRLACGQCRQVSLGHRSGRRCASTFSRCVSQPPAVR